MGAVAVVTDSTCDVPAPELAAAGASAVPLRVRVGEREGTDGEDVSAADVVRALRGRSPVTTSRPSPGIFAARYRALLDAGASAVVSVHLSSRLSGTWESARLAAEDFPYGAVRVVDSRATGWALGFAVLEACAAARSGCPAAEVQDAAVSTVDRTRTLLYVDTLDHLRRGGRIGPAAARLATSLSIKPLLQLTNGEIAPLEKVRTTSKALARLVVLTAQAAGAGPVDLAVQHLDAPDRAAALAVTLAARIPAVGDVHVASVGAVVGAHLGPGMVATVVVRR